MRVVIDGRPVEVSEKKTILEVAREQGMYIPSLCDHPRLVPFTGCRLCIVEVKGRRGVVPACGTYVEDGMDVTTSTPDIQKMRRQIMELILSEHPNACLICSERKTCVDYKSTIRKVGEVTGCVLCSNNGRCDLQNAVEYLGVERVGFPSLYRDLDVHKEDPFFDRDYNLCILCGRCVRICHEVRGASALAFMYRGPWTVIGTALGRPLLDSACQFCGACVDVCPTGALVEKAVKYETLPDATKTTICGFCSQGCELTLELKNGKILRSVPSEKGAVNRGQACVRGRFLVREAVYHPSRIAKPLVRRHGRLEEATWDEALGTVAGKFAGHMAKDIAVISAAQDSCEDLFALQKFCREGLKTDNVGGAEDFSPQTHLRDFGRRHKIELLLNFKIADIERAKTIVLFEDNLPVTQPIIGLEVYKAVRKGAKLVIIGEEEHCLNRCASAWIRIPLKRARVMLTSISRLLLDRDNSGDAAKTDGFPEFRKSLQGEILSEALSSLDLQEEKLLKLALLLEKRKPAGFLFGAQFSEGASGSANLAALWNLGLQTQGILIPLCAESNSRGAMEIVGFFRNSDARAGIIFPSVRDGAYRALYLAGPFPRLEKKPAEFVVLQDSYMNENADVADVILPQATFAETGGTRVNIEGRMQKFERAIVPQGSAKPGWQIVTELAQIIGLSGFAFKDASDVSMELTRRIPAFRGLDHSTGYPEAFVHERKADGKKFVAIEPPGEEPAVLEFTSDPDTYKGLRMSREIKGLNLIRGR